MCRRRHLVQMTGDGRVLKTGSRQTAGNANIVKVPAAMLVVYFVTMSISIHAPRVGSDQMVKTLMRTGRYFNPRSPCGERPDHCHRWGHRLHISIHAPRVGSDGEPDEKLSEYFPRFQSTLPVWGATAIPGHHHGGVADFNPRSPCGERHYTMMDNLGVAIFQSTLPVWGATAWEKIIKKMCRISIHAPRVGSDPGPAGHLSSLHQDFNPRSPCGERHSESPSPATKDLFQSTLPVWGATRQCGCYPCLPQISIHAPRVGSDRCLYTHPRRI